MENKFKADMQRIASQLRNPTGEAGLEMADQMHQSNILMTRHTIDSLKLRDSDRVLELGHGNAAHLAYLMGQAEEITYTGLEISETMQKAAKVKAEEFFQGRIHFELYDGLAIPFKAGSFDRVFTVNTIYFWSDPSQMAAELHRVLAPNGTAAITFALRSFMEKLPFTAFGFTLYEKSDVLELMEAAGFSIEKTEDHVDQVRSKAGEEVSRPFSIVLVRKR
ncbi:class I SAM-dependent methyltransferase [Algoriphagus sp. AGSA1]|uniref:class I SAM-dependent methyltransferase n=1 Tax=Algoriphagus sp. AGSA1 TaxID=2907213 RepID=UPI001F26883D|nr:class I SAM-dependent methyltransferase [Algoriphagus sp. AGSA1]MCE7054145.1 class I SAM-dependent methyltransferase [Algoriphagus sp. AGSA1]